MWQCFALGLLVLGVFAACGGRTAPAAAPALTIALSGGGKTITDGGNMLQVTHRYYFKLYALDDPLSLSNSATTKDVQSAMQGHILANAQLMGRYKR
jgi:phosphatidylethanolamine-binding protein (PEBP) family uncharacterized protein